MSELLFTAKILQEACALPALHRPNHLQLKFYTIMQDFKVFYTLIASKRRIEQLNFFDWLPNVKNLVFSNGSKHVHNVIQ